MKDRFNKQLQELKNTIQTFSHIERFFAGMVFFVAVMIPLPGTGPASLLLISGYAAYKVKRMK